MSTDWKQAARQELDLREAELVRRKSDLTQELSQVEARLSDLLIARRALGIEAAALQGAGTTPLAISAPVKEGLFKDIALELLEAAHPGSMKAADIQKQVEFRLQTKFHPKTSGMTLYRLSRDGAVRREGHNWFFVPKEERGL